MLPDYGVDSHAIGAGFGHFGIADEDEISYKLNFLSGETFCDVIGSPYYVAPVDLKLVYDRIAPDIPPDSALYCN
ncbi:hypothetical protein D5086_002686 [Populus alba]|uniref:Uncharacterized protein n=1 Tax=Populus alba TaxID=43335 RepID=A0ACC4D2B9_POPAL